MPKKTEITKEVAPKKTKNPTSFRLSDNAHKLLDALAVDTGLSQTGVLEMALRDLAKARNVKVSE